MIRQTTWNEFLGKNSANPRNAFEALCRLLFRNKFGIGDNLPYFYNNAGNETVPIQVGQDIVGFQSKFFSGNTIDSSEANQIIHSIETTHMHYPDQNKLIIYTNVAFGNPKGNETQTVTQKKIEKKAADNHLTIEWMFGDNILDLVDRTPLARALFFDLNNNIQRLPSSVHTWNTNIFKDINDEIPYKGKKIQIDRNKEIAELKELLVQHKHILISGESGSGKSAIIKQYWSEIQNNLGTAFLILKGYDFDTRSINDLFHFDEPFTYSGFCGFFEGHNNKIVVIDSAEKLIEQNNHVVLRLLLDGLCDKGWQFIFTCKNNSSEELHHLLNELSLPVSDININVLSEKDLKSISTQYNINLPSNQKVLHQIQIPFYLARYCEQEHADIASLEDFRELVWGYKVRGRIRGGNQQKREECLIQIVEEQLKKGSYFVIPQGIDHDIAYTLVQEDVLTTLPHKGYAVKHDLYIDWTLDYILERDFSTDENCLAVLKVAPKNISYINAFSRWLDCYIDTKDHRIKTIMDSFASRQVNLRWEHTILAAIGKSKEYASEFFSQYDSRLKANKFALFNKFIVVLDVSCKVVTRKYEYEREFYSVYTSIGKGWDQAILFVYDNKDTYYLDNLGSVLNLLQGYSKAGKNATANAQAAQLSLRIHEIVAQKRINGEKIWSDYLKPWSALVCTFAWGIKDQLRGIFQQIIQNQWIRHTDPYYELVEYILKNEDNFGKSMLYLSCIKEVIELMRLFWKELPKNRKDRHLYHYDTYGHEYVFALNEEFGMDMAYFPASPFQTPIGSLLSYEELLDKNGLQTLDFIIGFTDNCVKAYSERDKLDHKTVIPVKLSDGSQHEVISSQSLWNLYRGTQSYTIPNMMESYHMALESYLLRASDNKQQEPDWERLNMLLWRILNNSHSSSLYSIVASIVTAHPEQLFDELMFLCQDIRFLSYDLTRYSSEITASHKSITFHQHELWWKERKKSNELPHRQIHLERALLDIQYLYDSQNGEDAKKRLAKAYSVVERLRKQADELSMDNRTLLFIKERINYRGYKKEDVVLPNGQEAVMLTPTLPDYLQEESKKTEAMVQRMGAMSLRLWADKKFKGEDKSITRNPFADNPKFILKTIRNIENHVESDSNDLLLLPGDEYVPYMASVVLLMFYADALTEDEKEECRKRVMTALCNPAAMVSSSLSEFNVCIAAIPVIIDMFPQHQDQMIPVISGYAKLQDVYINERVCDLLSAVILNGNLWDVNPKLMYQALEQLKSDIPNKDFVSMDSIAAEAVLSLLTYNPQNDNRAIGDLCIDKITSRWQNEKERNSLMSEHYVADNVTNYILYAPLESVSRLMANLVTQLDRDYYSESILGEFVLNAAQRQRYANFWLVWETYYNKINELTTSYNHNQLLNPYLLNPGYLSRDYDDWFRLESKDLPFFLRASSDLGGNPTTIYALSRVFGTIGKPFVKESINIFHTIITKHHPRLENEKKLVVFYLEKITQKVLVEYENDIRTDIKFKDMLTVVLEYLRDNGSNASNEMLKIL